MKTVYVLAGILFVAIVGGAWAVQSTRKPEAPSPTPQEAPMPVVTQAPAEEMTTPSPSMTSKLYTKAPPLTIERTKTYTATITTSKGAMRLTLFADEAPVTVNNFVFLARAGFYDSTIFHRIMKGFMIQGGDPGGDGTGGPGYRFDDEKITRSYTRGTIAMANSGPNTNGSQFFIMHATYPLPKQYVIFGAIDEADAESLKTLDAIASSPVSDNGTGENSMPLASPVIQSISIKEE